MTQVSSEREVPDDYEECDICGFDHKYDGNVPGVQKEIRQAHQGTRYKRVKASDFIQGDR